MTRRYYRWDTERQEFYELGVSAPENSSAYVHQDTLKTAIRHPVTGELTDSVSRYMQINREVNAKEGTDLRIVGNELLSNQKRQVRDVITEERIMDACHRAEAIVSDPTKYRAHINRNLERFEQQEKLINGSRR